MVDKLPTGWLAGTAGELITAFGKLAPVSAGLVKSCGVLEVLRGNELTVGLIADDAMVNALAEGALMAVDAFAELVATSRVGLVARVRSLLPATTAELVTTSTLGMDVALAAVIGLPFAAGKLLFIVAMMLVAGELLLKFELVVTVAAVVPLLSVGSFLTKSLFASGVSEDIAYCSGPALRSIFFVGFDCLQFESKARSVFFFKFS